MSERADEGRAALAAMIQGFESVTASLERVAAQNAELVRYQDGMMKHMRALQGQMTVLCDVNAALVRALARERGVAIHSQCEGPVDPVGSLVNGAVEFLRRGGGGYRP